MTSPRLPAALLVGSVLMACGPRFSARDLPGTYVLNHRASADTLLLNANGTYIHSFVSVQDQRAATESGTWAVDTASGPLRLTLTDFAVTSIPDSGRTLPRRGLWVLELDQGWRGPLRLPVESDIGLYFVKQ